MDPRSVAAGDVGPDVVGGASTPTDAHASQLAAGEHGVDRFASHRQQPGDLSGRQHRGSVLGAVHAERRWHERYHGSPSGHESCRWALRLPPLARLSRLRGMETFSDPLAFPQPAWLAAHTEPNIEAMLELLSDETRRLYRQYLAEEVRAMRPGVLPAWRAFDRANLEMLRRNNERRAQ